MPRKIDLSFLDRPPLAGLTATQVECDLGLSDSALNGYRVARLMRGFDCVSVAQVRRLVVGLVDDEEAESRSDRELSRQIERLRIELARPLVQCAHCGADLPRGRRRGQRYCPGDHCREGAKSARRRR